jgi:ATP-binding cassette subfamily C (CFTR/MRP) protein 1
MCEATVIGAVHSDLFLLTNESLWLQTGEVVTAGTPEDVSRSTHEFGPLLAEVLTLSPSLKTQADEKEGTELESETESKVDASEGKSESDDKAGSKLVAVEDRASGKVGWPTYRAYIQAGGGAQFALAVCLVSALCQAARVGADVWLAVWAEGVDPNTVASEKLSAVELSPSGYTAVYALLTLVVIPLNILRTFGFVYGTIRSSRTLHNKMFGRVAKAPMVFFEENPLGRILNRFANDLVSTRKLTALYLAKEPAVHIRSAAVLGVHTSVIEHGHDVTYVTLDLCGP